MATATESRLSSMSTVTVRPSVVYAVEPWATYVQDAPPLWEAHWREVAIDQGTIPLDVDLDGYAALDALGKLLIVTVRADGALVGYWKGFVVGHLHYTSTLHGVMDIVYIRHAYRTGFTAWRLFKAVEAEARKRGVVRLTAGTKIHDGLDLSPLYERLGYVWTEKHFSKLLRA